MKISIVFLMGVILGAMLFFICSYLFYESEASLFINSQVSAQERISVDAFNHYPAKASNFIQINYASFFKKAKNAGLISDFEYQRAVSFANIRLCINYENEGDMVKANQFCKWAKDHLSQWRNDLDYKEFKNKHREAYNKKEIPDLSLEILNQDMK